MSRFMLPENWATSNEALAMGLEGRALFTTVGDQCANDSTDGLVARVKLRIYGAIAEVRKPEDVAGQLVELGVWHTAEGLADCDECQDDLRRHESEAALADGDFYWHRWLRDQLDALGKNDPRGRMQDLRKKAWDRNQAGKLEVQTRDKGMCRYCGIHVNPNRRDTKSANAFEWDHIDPLDKENAVAKIVVACKTCNAEKSQRTPEQWGVLLLPSPGTKRREHPAYNQVNHPGPGHIRDSQGRLVYRCRPFRGEPVEGLDYGHIDPAPDDAVAQPNPAHELGSDSENPAHGLGPALENPADGLGLDGKTQPEPHAHARGGPGLGRAGSELRSELDRAGSGAGSGGAGPGMAGIGRAGLGLVGQGPGVGLGAALRGSPLGARPPDPDDGGGP